MSKKANTVVCHKGGRIMAVSMGVFPVLKGDIAKKVLDDMNKPTMNREFLDKCSVLASKIKKGNSKK